MTIWLDIDDLLLHLARFSRPSGIQRVVHEAGAALRRVGGDRVAFVRRGHGPYDFRVTHWRDAEAAFAVAMSRTHEQRPPTPVRQIRLAHPDEAGGDGGLRAIAAAEAQVARSAARLVLGTLRLAGKAAVRKGGRVMSRLRSSDSPIVEAPPERFRADDRLADLARPGDVFLTLGAPWHHADYEHTVRWVRDDLRLSFALLIHDLVPLRHPEWCDRGIIETFTSWHRAMFPLADAVFTLSRATATDVERYLKAAQIVVPHGVIPVSAGTVCNLDATAMAPDPVVEGPYVLFVSTIEARKNHTLLFRVWRRLVSEMDPAQVPTLVFAGREGWLVADLMHQLDNTNWLDGKIRFVRNPSDAELHRLYADCLFTVFPSFFEGWGLPVTESLGMGKPCIASNSTSIPEAGGALARYFNPYDAHDAHDLIRDVINDPAGLARWTQDVRAKFEPVPWDRTATAILETLDSA